MAKAMLIMDMPTTCSECMLCDLNGCCLALKMVEFCEYRYDQKQKWCPLREVPQKKEVKNLNEALAESKNYEDVAKVVFDILMDCGYNQCIDELLGGGE